MAIFVELSNCFHTTAAVKVLQLASIDLLDGLGVILLLLILQRRLCTFPARMGVRSCHGSLPVGDFGGLGQSDGGI